MSRARAKSPSVKKVWEEQERSSDWWVSGAITLTSGVQGDTVTPLRGFVVCPDCETPLTAYWFKSKTGDKHPYYLCPKKGCASYRKSIRRTDLELDRIMESKCKNLTSSYERRMEKLEREKLLLIVKLGTKSKPRQRPSQEFEPALNFLKNSLNPLPASKPS